MATKATPKYRNALNGATSLVREVCMIADSNMFDTAHEDLTRTGIVEAVRQHDNAALYDWFVETLNFQGVADSIATSFLDQHGSVTYSDIENALAAPIGCPKLQSYWQFASCGYRKTLQTCSEPFLFEQCTLPRHSFRNGSLSQAAYSLFLFFRDVAAGDFVGWLDQRFADANARKQSTAWELAAAVVEPMTHIHGVSYKVINMALSALLIAGDPERELWQTAGRSMLVIDTLIHNWLHRTGILRAFGNEHLYGPGCYRPGGCANIVADVASQIDARNFNPAYAKRFPRFIEFCIWWFCAERGFNQCNGNRIDDRLSCNQIDCPLLERCGRVQLNPPRVNRATQPS